MNRSRRSNQEHTCTGCSMVHTPLLMQVSEAALKFHFQTTIFPLKTTSCKCLWLLFYCGGGCCCLVSPVLVCNEEKVVGKRTRVCRVSVFLSWALSKSGHFNNVTSRVGSPPESFLLLPKGRLDANLRLYIRFTAEARRLTVHQSINTCQAKKNIWREG